VRQAIDNGHISGDGAFTKRAHAMLQAIFGGDARVLLSASADPSGRRYARRVPGRVVSLSRLTILTGDGALILGGIDPSTPGLKMSSTLR
jgi:hypothetical protein